MYTADSEEGKKLKSLGFDKWDVSSRSRIPTVRNFENKSIRENLPSIVEEATELEALWGSMYDANQRELSQIGGGRILGLIDTGISKEKYIKDNVKKYIKDQIDLFRNPTDSLVALDDPQKILEYQSMTDYRRLSKNQRSKGWFRFVEEEERSPFDFTSEYLERALPEFEDLSADDKEQALKNLKLQDLQLLFLYGKESP
jgi:hypothetical protein